MKIITISFLILVLALVISSCNQKLENADGNQNNNKMTAQYILSNPDYLAISYGGYRSKTRETQPTIEQLKEDLLLLNAMGVKVLRTYNMQLPHATNVVKAIDQLKQQNPDFEMYVMLGAWIDCLNAWTGMEPHHHVESPNNAAEIQRAVELTQQYPDIIKVIAVGNEAMVKWATSYFVQPDVILKWVQHLQDLKQKGDLPKDLWITSSDNFASWGGGDPVYHVDDLNKLIKAVDFISVHTYPMHDTHYNPVFWGTPFDELELSKEQKIHKAMQRAVQYAASQYQGVYKYMKSIGVDKPIHIGETGWATNCNEFYGDHGAHATDEYKSGIYYKLMREWTKKNNIACFYFEAFDEQWKDSANPHGSENHFGLFTLNGKAKYALWDLVNNNTFKGLTRDGHPITPTFNGDKDMLLEYVQLPPTKEIHFNYDEMDPKNQKKVNSH